MITVAISGSSGFLGTQLWFFLNHKYNIIKLKRSDYSLAPDKLAAVLKGSDYIINLAGASVNGLWTKTYRSKILKSRIETTRSLVNAITFMEPKPKLFISASGINIYDDIGVHNEQSAHYGSDFLSRVCQQWEQEASVCPVPFAILRTGIVIGQSGGFYKAVTITKPFGIVVRFGSGQQYFPFLSINDYVAAVSFIIQRNLSGIFNLVTPEMVTYRAFYEILKQRSKFLCVVPVPSFFLKLLPGGQSVIFLKGQQVVPSRLVNEGFVFSKPSLAETI